MKIAILSITSGHVYRGMETVVDELSKRWVKHHQVTVYQAGKEDSNHSYEIKKIPSNIDWQKYFKPSSLSKYMLGYYHQKTIEFTYNALRQIDKPDIIIPCNGGWQSLLCRLWSWQKQIPMVITGQAGLGFCDGWNLLMRPDTFIAVSKRNKRWSQQFYGKGVPIEVIPNGVDLKRFSPEGNKIEVPLESPIILCVAGWDKYKRVKETIDAITKGSLLLVGGNEEIENYGHEKLGNRFMRKNFNHAEMPDVYRAADVFTLVSESSEAFGIAYIEALASGLPIVATDDDLRHELLRDRALYIKDPTQSKEYSDLLQQAIKLTKQSPPSWITQYNWDSIADRYENVFNNL